MSIKLYQDKLQAAAEALAEAYTEELETYPMDAVPASPSMDVPLEQMLRDAMYAGALPAVISAMRGNQSKSAELLGINRSTLRKRLKRMGFFDNTDQKDAA